MMIINISYFDTLLVLQTLSPQKISANTAARCCSRWASIRITFRPRLAIRPNTPRVSLATSCSPPSVLTRKFSMFIYALSRVVFIYVLVPVHVHARAWVRQARRRVCVCSCEGGACVRVLVCYITDTQHASACTRTCSCH